MGQPPLLSSILHFTSLSSYYLIPLSSPLPRSYPRWGFHILPVILLLLVLCLPLHLPPSSHPPEGHLNVILLCSVTRPTRMVCDNDSATGGEKEVGRCATFSHLRFSPSSFCSLLKKKTRNHSQSLPLIFALIKMCRLFQGGKLLLRLNVREHAPLLIPSADPRRDSFNWFCDFTRTSQTENTSPCSTVRLCWNLFFVNQLLP